MAKKKKKETPVGLDEPIPDADAGRMAGLIARQDPDLWNAVKQYATMTGKNPGEALKEIVAKGLAYEMYKDIDGATIMKVMDILDRIQGYMTVWLQRTSLEQNLSSFQALLELTDTLAPQLGYVRPEQIKQQVKETVKKKTLLDVLVDRLADQVAERISEQIIKSPEAMKLIEKLATGDVKLGVPTKAEEKGLQTNTE